MEKTLTGYTPGNTYDFDSRNWHQIATGQQAQSIFDKLLTNPNIKIIADNRIELTCTDSDGTKINEGYILQ